MENGVDYYCTNILNCCYRWSFFHHKGIWCNEDCFKIVFRRRPCSLSCSLSHRRPCSRSGNTRWRGATQSHRYTNTNEYLNFYIFPCFCVPVCACLFVQHRATGISIYNKGLIFQCMTKKCLILTQGDTFRRFLKWFDFSKLFAFSKISEFLFCRCWHYHFVLLHPQPSQTRPRHRFFQSPVSNCPRIWCLCLI